MASCEWSPAVQFPYSCPLSFSVLRHTERYVSLSLHTQSGMLSLSLHTQSGMFSLSLHRMVCFLCPYTHRAVCFLCPYTHRVVCFLSKTCPAGYLVRNQYCLGVELAEACGVIVLWNSSMDTDGSRPVAFSFQVLFRRYGWSKTSYMYPFYRIVTRHYDFDDYASKGSVVYPVRKYHRNLRVVTGAPLDVDMADQAAILDG